MKLWDTKSRWEKAHAMYGVNKSFREIEAELYLPRSSIHRRALAENWQKGFLMPLVHEMIRVEQLMRQLTPIELKAVEHEVNRILKIRELDPDSRNPWLNRLV